MIPMKAMLGGTFNVLHDGHKALIQKAFELSNDVIIGLTCDKMASSGRKRVNPYYLRMKSLIMFLESIGRAAEIVPLSDKFGSAAKVERGYLIVSKETEDNAKLINKKRVAAGLEPLIVSVIDMVKGKNGFELHARDILSGECSRDGDTDVMTIAVGSLNHVKVEAVRTVMEKIYGNVRIIPVNTESGVPEQPFGDEAHKGAVNRATAALGTYELSVGIEAGVFEMYGYLYDVQYCAILSKDGKITVGMGPGFRYPDKVAELVRNGMNVSDAMSNTYGSIRPGNKEGAIGILSKGLLDRKALTEQSITAAMIPRIWDEP